MGVGASDAAAAMVESQAKVQTAFKTGGGVQWGDQAPLFLCDRQLLQAGLSRQPGR